MVFSFIQNAVLLITLSAFYGLIIWYRPKETVFFHALAGFWFGIVSITAMMMPFEFIPGVIFDGRSVILTLAGFFGGGITTLMAVIIAGAYRIYLGGIGIWAGLTTIVLCGLTGLFFRKISRYKPEVFNFSTLILIGFVSHVVMLASQLLLPGQTRFQVISQIWIPVMLVFPLTFAVISRLFQLINVHIKNEKDLRAAEELYRTTLLSIGDAVIVTNITGKIIKLNTVAENLTGWTLNEANGKNLSDIFNIINEDTRKPVENPVNKVMKDGKIVGLANHTMLISKDGKEIPIADSAAPVKNKKGELTGVVLVFSDQSEERKYQQDLARKEAQYRELVESTEAIAWEYDILLDKWMYVAPQVTEKLGWLPEEWTNLDFWKNNVHPDEREGAVRYCLGCTAKGVPHSLEYRFRSKEGHYIWLRDVVSVELHENQAVKIRGVMFDITERKNAEIDLKEKNTFIQTILDNLPIGIALNKIDEGTAFYMNRRFEEIYGWKAAELEDIPTFFQHVYPDQDYRTKVVQMIMKGMESGDPQRMHWENVQITRGDGTKGFVNAVNIPLTDQNTIVSTVMDITARTMAEMKLKESEERFSRAILLAPFPIMMLKEDGQVIHLSSGWTHYSGYHLDDIPTLKLWTQKAYGEKAQQVEDYVNSMFTEKKTFNSGEFEITTKTGEKRIWDFFSTPLGKFSDGKKIMLSIAADITDKRHLFDELVIAKDKAEESERLKSAFLANMSHEIRTPLNGILGFSSLLTGNGELSQTKKQKFAAIINKSGESLLKIINDILDISKLETNRTTIEKKPFDAGEMLSTVYAIFQKKLADSEKTHLELKMVSPEKQLILNTDENRLIQVFSNLLDNAIRFTPKGQVSFGMTCDEPNRVNLFVSDTGIGIKKDMQQIIFERFSQADDHFTRSYGGTGLGLTISKKLVELMGGEITLDSEPGKGATFSFSLPSVSFKTSAEVINEEKANSLPEPLPARILIVEDDAASSLLFSQVLNTHFDDLLFAETGKEALRLYETRKPDIILMDIGLPDMDGLEVVRKIREKDQKVCIIAQTGFAMADDKQKAIEAGCNDYITKPLETELLFQTIQKHSYIK